MLQSKRSYSLLPQSTSLSRFKEGKGKEPLVNTTSKPPSRRRASAVRVAFCEDSTDSDQHSSKSYPSTSASSPVNPAKLLRLPSRAGLKSIDTSSHSSLRSLSKTSPVPPKNALRSRTPRPLKLDQGATVLYHEQSLSGREPASPSYEVQFRRRRGDLLHRFGQSVPYMQAYDPTSLRCDALTTRLLESLCEPGTPCFYKFRDRSAVTTALDLGCGPQLLWAKTAARCWPNAKVIGVDCVRPNPEVQIPSNVEFLQQNFLEKLSTVETESVDFVRMSCLGTSVPELEWPVVLTEASRILRPGGVIEIIDDELYPAYLPEARSRPIDHRDSDDEELYPTHLQKKGMHLIDQHFRKMLVDRYGMPEVPHATIENAMEIAFGKKEKKSFHVELPTTIEGLDRKLFQTSPGKGGVTRSVPHDAPAKAQRVLGLDNKPSGDRVSEPFLILQHRLCHLEASDVRMAACGNMHKVLSCRASLIDFIAGPGAEGEGLDEVTDMLWLYERFYQEKLNLPDETWNEFGGERKASGKKLHRASTESHDSGYASHSSSTIKAGKAKASTSVNDRCLVRRFWVFHATKV